MICKIKIFDKINFSYFNFLNQNLRQKKSSFFVLVIFMTGIKPLKVKKLKSLKKEVMIFNSMNMIGHLL